MNQIDVTEPNDARPENWFKWDVHSRSEMKIQWYLSGYVDKASAYGLLIWLIEAMYQTGDGWLPVDEMFLDITAQATGWDRDRLSVAITRLVTAKVFVECEGKVTDERVQQNIFQRFRIKKVRSEAGRKGALITNSSRQLLGNQSANGGRKAEESRSDKKRSDVEKKKDPTPSFPSRWGQRAQAAFARWSEYRRDIRKPLRLTTLQAQINSFADDPQKFAALVDRAIRNGWQGLNDQVPLENDVGRPQVRERKAQNIINQENTANAVKEILQECGHEIGRNNVDNG